MTKPQRHRFRLSDENLYDIIFLMMTGFSNKQISVRLAIPQQTIMRNTSVIRRLLFEDDSFYDLLKEYFWIDFPSGRQYYLFPEVEAIYDLGHRIPEKRHDNATLSEEINSCLLECPMMPDFNHLREDRVHVRYLLGTFIYPTHVTFADYKKLDAQLAQRKNCKGCRLKEASKTIDQSTKFGLSNELFFKDRFSNYWLGATYYMKLFRWRTKDEFLLTFLNATIFALWLHRMNTGIEFLNKPGADANDFLRMFYKELTDFVNGCMGVLGRRDDFGIRFPSVQDPEKFYELILKDRITIG